MANPNAIVSRSIRLAGAEARAEGRMVGPQGLEVELDDGRRVRLDPQNPRSEGFASVLAGLAKLRHPVYLELDPETEAVSRILIPTVGRVVAVREVDAGLEVEVENSHARNLLRRDRPDFEEFEEALRAAQAANGRVLLTPDDGQNVEDIRLFRPGPDDGPVPDLPHYPETRLDWLDKILWLRIWPWVWWRYRCSSSARAQEIFDTMSATTCNPAGIAPPCIPFMFPDNGCWARAHEMRRLMNNMGIYPRKVWIRGILHTPTKNHPNCFVNWSWHVAPTICVRTRWRWWYVFWWWWGERMVIDPSLFTTPVTQDQWKAVQGDPNATLTDSSGTIYRLLNNNETDDTYAKTNVDLQTYRIALQNRVNQVGAPPYANCP